MRLFAKSPMEMRREAEQGRHRPKPIESGPVDPSKRPLQASETPREVKATAEWLAHVEAGRIVVR